LLLLWVLLLILHIGESIWSPLLTFALTS
jgi:hypothetical protein